MKFNNPYSRQRLNYEKPSGPSRVEKAGYIPANIKIQSLMSAGKRLVESRAEQYDFLDDKSVDHDFYDPTRRPGFDMADASIMENALEARIEARIQAEKLKAIEKDKEESKKALQAKTQDKDVKAE